MRGVGKKDIATLLKQARDRHEEVSRALSNDKYVLEKLDEIICSLKDTIENETLKKEKIINETNNIGLENKNILEEKDRIINEFMLLSSNLNDINISIEEARKRKDKEKECAKLEIENTRKEIDSEKKILIKEIKTIKKEIDGLKNVLIQLKNNKKHFDSEIKSRKSILSNLNKDILKAKKSIEDINTIERNKRIEELKKQKEKNKLSKIKEQKIIEEKLKLKEIRRNKQYVKNI